MIDLSALAPPLPSLDAAPSEARVRNAWPEICERRKSMDEAELAYVEVWCGRARDGDAATIARLRGVANGGGSLATAARDDLITLLAASDEPHRVVERELAASLDAPSVRARLALAYLQAGREQDARALGAAPGTRAACTIALRDLLAHANAELATALAALGSGACGDDARAIPRRDRRARHRRARRRARPRARALGARRLADGRDAGARRDAVPRRRDACDRGVLQRESVRRRDIDRVVGEARQLRARADRDPTLDGKLDRLIAMRGEDCKP